MDTLLQDLRYALRTLAKAPGFALVAVITLALGIGANTAVFSVIDAALLRPLPFAEPRRLVVLENAYGPGPAGYPKETLDLTDWAAQPGVFDAVTSYEVGGLNLAGPDGSLRVQVAQVMPNFHGTLGVAAALGRGFLAEEGTPDRAGVVVLSDGLWRRAYGSDPHVVGRVIVLNDRSFMVVGVMPPGFTYPRRTEVWIPHPSPDNGTNWDMFHAAVQETVIGRLRRDLTIAEAQARVRSVETAFRSEHLLPEGAHPEGVVLHPLRQVLVGDARTGLLVLFGAVGLILLIACTNAAGLLLARAASRQHEIAVRAVLGATRARVLRQLVTESALLALAGSAAGLVLAWWALGTLAALLPPRLADVTPVTLDVRVLAFTLVAAGLATLLFGLVPALGLSNADLHEPLKAGGYRAPGVRARRTRGVLVAGETGLALVLLIGAGLMLKSLYTLEHVDPGFRRESVLTATVSLPSSKYRAPGSYAGYFSSALQHIDAVPGVEAAGAVNALPLLREGAVGFIFQIVGRPPFPMGENRPFAEHLVITPQYFRAMGIPVLRGRGFTDADDATGPKVMIISESMAKRYWSDASPLGSQIKLPIDQSPRTIVGVVRDVRDGSLNEQVWALQMYLPYQQSTAGYMTFTVRARIAPSRLVGAVRRALGEVDPTIPLYDVHTMDEVVATSIAPERRNSLLIALAGVLAVALAAVGVYGVMAQAAAQRTHEIGIRIALGAAHDDVLWLLLRHGMILTLAGVAGGLAAAWAATRVMAHLLYQVSVTDVSVFIAAPLALVAVALLASYLPARRATKVDPMVALRTE
jgi:putative ABC transport system permease protein